MKGRCKIGWNVQLTYAILMYYTSLEFGPIFFCICIEGCFAYMSVCLHMCEYTCVCRCICTHAHVWRSKGDMSAFCDLYLIWDSVPCWTLSLLLEIIWVALLLQRSPVLGLHAGHLLSFYRAGKPSSCPYARTASTFLTSHLAVPGPLLSILR